MGRRSAKTLALTLGFRVLERGPAIEAEARHSKYRKLDREHLSLFAVRVVPRGAVSRSHGAVCKGLSVQPGLNTESFA